MIKMGLAELEEYCMTYYPRMFVYSSEHQSEQSGDQQFELYFTDIIIRRFTNRIGFRCGNSLVCFNRVKYVQLSHDEDGFVRLEIICSSNKNKIKSYVIIFVNNIF